VREANSPYEYLQRKFLRKTPCLLRVTLFDSHKSNVTKGTKEAQKAQRKDKPFVNLCVFSVNLCVTAKKAMSQKAQRRHKLVTLCNIRKSYSTNGTKKAQKAQSE